MHRSMIRKPAVLLCMVLAAPLAAIAPLTVRSGHDAPIAALVALEGEELLFSAGEDGKLLVWDTGNGNLLQTIRADQLPIRRMLVYPDAERVALYSSDGQRHRITVWDWRDGERRFLHTAEDEVLDLAISSRSTYLVYASPSRQSLTLLDGDSGRRLPYLRTETGIVGWLVISTSEERVMTYSPASGDIVYREIRSGQAVASFTAPRDLQNLMLLESRRFAAGIDPSGQVVVIDLLSGDVADRVPAGTIESLQPDPATGEILAISRTFGERLTVLRYEFDGSELSRRYATRREFPDGLSTVVAAGRGFFAGTEDGLLLRWLPFGADPLTFAGSIVEPVTDLYVRDGRVNMLSAQRIISVASDFFSDQRRQNDNASFIRQSMVRIDAGAGARFLSDAWSEEPAGDERSRLMLWTPQNPSGRVQNYSLGSTRPRPVQVELPAGLVAVDLYQDELLTLSRAGQLALHDLVREQTRLNYRGRGLQTAIRTSRGVFVGRAGQGLLDASVLRLDAVTSETIPLQAESDLVFFLNFDERRGRLYAIGIRRDDSGVTTLVEVFEGADFTRSRTILEVPGEYLDAVIIHDPVTGTAYTTLDDRGGILRWDGTRVSELLRNPAHIPERIFLQGDFLFSLNRDGTVSVVDRFRGEPILDLYVLADTDGAWLAVRPDGRYLSSSDRLADSSFMSLNGSGSLASRRIELAAGSDTTGDGDDAVPVHRFESAEDPEIIEETENFDPESGEIAPSS